MSVRSFARETTKQDSLPQINSKGAADSKNNRLQNDQEDPLFSKKNAKSLVHDASTNRGALRGFSQHDLSQSSSSHQTCTRTRQSDEFTNEERVLKPLASRADSRGNLLQNTRNEHGSSSNLLSRAGSRNMLSSAARTKSSDLLIDHREESRQPTGKQSQHALKRGDGKQDDQSEYEATIKKIDKTVRKLDTRLEKAEGILFQSNMSFFKASSTNLFAPESPVRKGLVSEEYDLFDPHLNPKPEDHEPTGDAILSPISTHIMKSASIKDKNDHRLTQMNENSFGSNASNIAAKNDTTDGNEGGIQEKKKIVSRSNLLKSNSDISKMEGSSSRLADHTQYTSAFVAKMEASRLQREQLQNAVALEKKQLKRSMQNLSSNTRLNSSASSSIIDRLAQPKGQTSQECSNANENFNGYAPGFRPLDEKAKEKLRSLRSMNNINFFEPEPASPIDDQVHEPSSTIPDCSIPSSEPKQALSSLGLVADLPPPRAAPNRR